MFHDDDDGMDVFKYDFLTIDGTIIRSIFSHIIPNNCDRISLITHQMYVLIIKSTLTGVYHREQFVFKFILLYITGFYWVDFMY